MEKENLPILWNSRFYIGNVKIPLKTQTNNTVFHYSTKVAELNQENKIVALDGFSLTDYSYLDLFLREKRLRNDFEIYFRRPKYGNSAFILKTKDEILIPEMSFDNMFYDYDTANFYLKPLKNNLGFKDIDSLLNNSYVINQYGYKELAKNVKPSYFPYLRELTYDKPDMTLILYSLDDNLNITKNVIDIYNKYYFDITIVKRWYEKIRALNFMGYVFDLTKLDVIPFMEFVKYKTDAWRGFYQNVDITSFNEKSGWIKLSNSEWAGAYSESEELLKDVENELLKLLYYGLFEYVLTIISYSSNIFVNYIDFYVKQKSNATNIAPYYIKNIINKIQKIEIREIIENIFHLK